MNSDYKAKSPLEAYKKAWEAIAITWDNTQLIRFLPQATLHDYRDGAFTFCVPTQHMANVMSRHAELSIIRRTLELYMPEGMTVSVAIISGEVQP